MYKQQGKFAPRFEMPEERTLGDIWHEEVERENPVLAFLVFAAAIFVILALVVILGTQPAYASEMKLQSAQSIPSISKIVKLEKAKLSAVKSMEKSYSKWKSNMTKDQRKAYQKLVWKVDRTKKASDVKKYKEKVKPYISRAKLCVHINARGFSNSKVDYVWKWGKRVNSYLSGSPMAGTGWLTASIAKDHNMDPRLSPAIAKVESGKGIAPYGCQYNVWGWVWQPPAMYSWEDALTKWHSYFSSFWAGEYYPIQSMHGYGGYGPWYVNQEMAKI